MPAGTQVHNNSNPDETDNFQKLKYVVELAWERSDFYYSKWSNVRFAPSEFMRMSDISRLPLTTQEDFISLQASDSSRLSTVPIEQFVAVHQNNSETNPVSWYDDQISWDWVQEGWEYVRNAAKMGGDRRTVFFADDFSPKLWFWAGFENIQKNDLFSFTGGSLDKLQKVKLIFELEFEILIVSQQEALELAQIAVSNGYNPRESNLKVIIHDNPMNYMDDKLQQIWGVDTFGVVWTTVTGIIGYQSSNMPNCFNSDNSRVFCEVIDRTAGKAALQGELVVTLLGRTSMPVVRFCTGFFVKKKVNSCSRFSTFEFA